MINSTALGFELQQKMYGLLSSDSLDNALGGSGRVFDHIPDNQAFPYVVFGEEDIQNMDSDTHNGFQGTATVRVYTQNTARLGRKQCKEIMSAVWQLLHNAELNMTERNTLNFACVDQQIIKDEDGRTHQGVMIFDFKFGGNEI